MSLPLCATGSMGGAALLGVLGGLAALQAVPVLLSLVGSAGLLVLALFAGSRSHRAVRSLSTAWVPVNAALAAGVAWLVLKFPLVAVTPGAVGALALGLALFGLAPLATSILRRRAD